MTADGSWAAHFEHTVAITEDGPWVLTAPDGGASGLRRARPGGDAGRQAARPGSPPRPADGRREDHDGI